MIADGTHVELREDNLLGERHKQIKYMNIVANAIILHNEADLTEVLGALEGHASTEELVARLRPYIREHIRRFGQYVLDVEEQPPPLEIKPVPIDA